MNSGIYKVQVSLDFSAAHSLRNYEGKCENLHGHNFIVEVELEGEELDKDVEILVDFKKVKEILKGILDELDHTNLNEHPYFIQKNPSSENIARYIFESMNSRIQKEEDLLKRGVKISWVSVSENKGSKGIYARK